MWLPRQELQETWVLFLGQEDPLEEEMSTHSSILAWRIPWTEDPWWATVHGVSKSWTWLSMHVQLCKTTELHEAGKATYKQRCFNKLYLHVFLWKTSSKISISSQLLLTLWGTVSLSAVSGTHQGSWNTLPMHKGGLLCTLLAATGKKLALSVKAI